ncbi:hypothetical protein [Litorimonas haliclonae]|uniref:hypothetical protein n=1 Tax=Litorimonas haliclonae TaxID=2081977 RepID=UPI0039F06A11
MLSKFSYLYAFFLVFAGGCSFENNKSTPKIPLYDESLPILKGLIDRVAKNSSNNLVLNSTGGSTRVSLEIAKLLKDNHIDLIVDKECSSNCAEILLPSANTVTFKNNPIIAFHGNILSYKHFLNSSENIKGSKCNWQYAYDLEKILIDKDMNLDFWSHQMERLEPNVTFEVDRSGCPWRRYNFKNIAWLPNSNQLRNMWGLKFSGSVCADRINLCRKKIDKRWEKGTRIVIGDEIYVSGDN